MWKALLIPTLILGVMLFIGSAGMAQGTDDSGQSSAQSTKDRLVTDRSPGSSQENPGSVPGFDDDGQPAIPTIQSQPLPRGPVGGGPGSVSSTQGVSDDGLPAVSQIRRSTTNERSPNAMTSGSRAVGDKLFTYDIEAFTGEQRGVGLEFTGNNWWTTSGVDLINTALYRFDRDFTALLNTYSPGHSGWGWRDLGFDGFYLYGSDSYDVEQIDPASGAVTGVKIPSPISPARAMAYDPATDTFWTASWSSDIYNFDRNGNVLSSTPSILASSYGMAWNDKNASQPVLLIWSQDGGGAQCTEFDPIALTFGTTWQGDGLAGIAGGAAFYLDTTHGYVLAGLHQGSPDVICGYSYGSGPSGASLTTTFAGGNGYAGNMFDITPTDDLQINALDIHDQGVGSTSTVELWYRPGTSVGYESSSSGWTLIGTYSGVAAGFGVGTFIDISGNGVTFSGGSSYGFFVNLTSYGVGGSRLNYTNGNPTTYSNADLSLLTNCGKATGGFTGSTFADRMWNGTIYYHVLPSVKTLTTLFAANNGAAGNTFDIIPKWTIDKITGVDVNVSGTGSALSINVWYKKGTAVGYENTPSAWILLDAGTGTSAGENNPSYVDLPGAAGVRFEANQTYGMYVDVTSYPTTGCRYTNGGPITYENSDLKLITNTGHSSNFSSKYYPRQWNGTIYYALSPDLVELAFFRAYGKGSLTAEVWKTTSEIDTAGFHVWRADVPDPGPSDFFRISNLLIPAKGGPTLSARYFYLDRGVISGHPYWYKLEDIDYGGQSTFHDPVPTRWLKP